MGFLRFPYTGCLWGSAWRPAPLKSWGEENFHVNLVCLQKTEKFERNLASTSGLMDLQFEPDAPRPRVLRLANFQRRFQNVTSRQCTVLVTTNNLINLTIVHEERMYSL